MFGIVFKPSYEAQNIIVRHDGSDVTNSKKVIESYGYLTPLVRCGNFSFVHDDIKSFNLYFGKNFFPTCTVSVSDNYDKFKESIKAKIDIFTIYISGRQPQFTAGTPTPGPRDQYFMRLDFLITNVSGYGNSVTLSGEYFCSQTDTLYTVHTRTFDTVKDCVETICKACGLGLIHWYNYQYPEPPFKIIQDGCSNLDMLKQIESWGGAHSKTKMFIDNLNYLNIVDMIQALKDKSPDTTCYDHVTRTTISQIPIIFNNREGYDEESEDYKMLKLGKYVHDTNHAEYCRIIPGKNFQDLHDYDTFEKPIDNEEVGFQEEMLTQQNSWLMYPTHVQPILSQRIDEPHLTNKIAQLGRLEFNPMFFMPQLYAGMTIKIEMYKQLNSNTYDNQETQDTDAVADKNAQMHPTRYTWIKNDLLTDFYYVEEIQYQSSFGKQMKQIVTGISKKDFA